MVSYLWEEMWGYMPLNCKDYIVADNLSFYKMWLVTYSSFQLQYHGSIPWVNEYHGWILQYHEWMPFTIPWVNSMGWWVPWVDFTIPWADAIYNTMGKFHGLMNNMGGWVPWVDAIFHSDQYVHLIILEQQKRIMNLKRNIHNFIGFVYN